MSFMQFRVAIDRSDTGVAWVLPEEDAKMNEYRSGRGCFQPPARNRQKTLKNPLDDAWEQKPDTYMVHQLF